MWRELKHIHHPDTLEKAAELLTQPGHALVAGGASLCDDRPDGVSDLIAVTPLLDNHCEVKAGQMVAGAGTSLQDFLEFCETNDLATLKYICELYSSSPNLRNQHTIGGILCRHGRHSILSAALHVLGARLNFHKTGIMALPDVVTSSDILLDVRLPQKHDLVCESQSRLQSAAPWMAVCAARHGEEIRLALTGTGCPSWQENCSKNDSLSSLTAPTMQDDQYGSAEYKSRLFRVLCTRMEAKL